MDSIRFNAVNTQPALPALPNKVETAPQAPPPQGDSVSIGGLFKDAVKVTAGTVVGLGMGTARAVASGVYEANNSALKAMGLEGSTQTKGQAVKKALVILGGFAGIAACSTLGFPGMLAGILAGPGMVGGVMEAGRGAIQGGKTGLGMAKMAGEKTEAAISPKLGQFAGKAAKFAVKAATAMVATPLMAIAGSVSESLGFAKKAIGFNPNAESGKEKLANVAKVGAVALTYIDGLAEGGGLIEGGIAGAAVAGGMATTVKGAIGAGKGFMEGFKEGYRETGKEIDNRFH